MYCLLTCGSLAAPSGLPGFRRSPLDAIQSILVVTVALCQPTDRSAALDAHEGSQ